MLSRSDLSSIFLPLYTMPLGILPTNRNQSPSTDASSKLLVYETSPIFGKYESSSSITKPFNLSTTCGISTRHKSTVLSPKVFPSTNLGINE